MVSAASATNRPLSVIERKKSGPPSCPGCDSVTLTAIAISTGTAASTSQAGLVAPPAEDQPQLGDQERRLDSAAAAREPAAGAALSR